MVEILANELGNRITPSFVNFNPETGLRTVGDAAKALAPAEPFHTVFDAKRLIGRRYDDPKLQKDLKYMPFNITKKNDKPVIVIERKGEMKEYLPEEISAMVLEKMKSIGESFLATNITNAVVTVPAYL